MTAPEFRPGMHLRMRRADRLILSAGTSRGTPSMSAKSPRLASTRGVFLPKREGQSAPRHRDVDAADLALGVDLHRLLGAVGAQCQVGGEAVGLDEHVDLAAAGGALEVTEDVAAGLAPIAGDPVALTRDVAGEVQLVAVAGAVQGLLQVEA